MNDAWVTAMIGVRFVEKGRDLSGWDCWGAVAYGLRQGFGIVVPSYTEAYTTSQEGAEIAALIGRESPGWLAVPLAEALPGDVLILRIHGQPWHCGLVLEPPAFLHADGTLWTVRDRWDSPVWSRRIIGLYRHPEMAARRLARSDGLQEAACPHTPGSDAHQRQSGTEDSRQ